MAKTVLTKICPTCKKTKTVSKFGKCKPRKNSLNWCCKVCASIRNKKWSKKNYIKRKLIIRKYELKRVYNLSLEDFDRMFEAQNGLCAVCGKSETETYKGVVKRLSIDHSHKTEKIRELLCGSCNRMLGQAKDNIDILKLAIKYLKKHE